jgi:hypothetical protein
MNDVERLLAYEEIRQLASRYAVALDGRDFDTIVQLFVEDYRHWDGRVGRDALHDALTTAFHAGLGGRAGFTQVGTHKIELADADHASGVVYCLAEFGDQERWIRQAIGYLDTYERRDGRWYFTFRDHQLFYGVRLDIRPLDQRPANWPSSPIGVGTLPYAWESWQQFHGETEG